MFMKKTLFCLLILIFLLMTGCSLPNNNSVNSDNLSSVDILERDDNVNKDFYTAAKKITSSQLKNIKSGDTYQEIINKIGNGKDYNQYESDTKEDAQYIYLVDETYVFCLSFEALNDVSAKSGKEYIKDLRPAFPPNKFSEYIEEGYMYGVLIKDSLICIGNDGSEYYDFHKGDATISFSNKTSASYDDLTELTCLLVKVDRIMETNPPQLVADEIIIVK